MFSFRKEVACMPELSFHRAVREEAYRIFREETGYRRHLLRWQRAQSQLIETLGHQPTEDETRRAAEELWLEEKGRDALIDWYRAEQNVLDRYGCSRRRFVIEVEIMAYQHWLWRSRQGIPGSQDGDWELAERAIWTHMDWFCGSVRSSSAT